MNENVLDELQKKHLAYIASQVKADRKRVTDAIEFARKFLPDLTATLDRWNVPYAVEFHYNEVRVVVPWVRSHIDVVDLWFAQTEVPCRGKYLTDSTMYDGTLRYVFATTDFTEFTVFVDANNKASACKLIDTGEKETFTQTRIKYRIECPEPTL